MKNFAASLNFGISISVVAAAAVAAMIAISSPPHSALAQTNDAPLPPGALPGDKPRDAPWATTVGPRLAGLPDPYRQEDNWTKLPNGRKLGGAAGIAIDPDGKSVWYFERCGNANNGCALPENKDVNPILEFDTNGNLLKQFGAGLGIKYPHGIFIDKDHNIWIADGTYGGPADSAAPKAVGDVVRKLSPDGKLLMTLGTPGKPGKGPYLFTGVSDVKVAANGDIFVADGHTTGACIAAGKCDNDRIVKYDHNGKYLMEWGHAGTGPADLNPPHSIAFDNEGRLYVADRSNHALKVFDQNGKLLHNWPQFGAPSGVYINKNDVLYVVDCNSTEYSKSQWYDHGFSPGVRVARVSDGKILANIPWLQQGTPEGVTADDTGTVYVALTTMEGSHRWFKIKN